MALNGQHWGIPLSYGNNLMLLYNKKLVDKAPADTAELIKMAQDFQAKNPNKVGLAFNQTEPFWLVPWLGGFGGKVFADDGKTPTLNTPEMVKTLQLVSEFKNKDKIVPKECDYNCADSMFKNGDAAMIINGDWSLGDYSGQRRVNYGHQEHRSGHGAVPEDHRCGLPQAVHGGCVSDVPEGSGGQTSARPRSS